MSSQEFSNLPKINLNEMLVFSRVVESGSFTKAADSLAMPKSTVSRRISQLEKRLGVRLLNRTTRRLELTEIGSAYYERCTRIVADAHEADIAVLQGRTGLRGLVRLSSPRLFAEEFLGPVLINYTRNHPEVDIELVLEDNPSQHTLERFDVILSIGNPSHSGMKARTLGQTRSMCCASPEYIMRHGTPESPKDLAQHRCLVFSDGFDRSPSVWRFSNAQGFESVLINPKMTFNSYNLIREIALSGQGIARIPIFMCKKDIERGWLVPILGGAGPESIPVQVLEHDRLSTSPKVDAFLNALLEHARTSLFWDASP